MTARVETERNQALMQWYAASDLRALPWRGETDPYRILVSEFMLQQTQAGRVVDPYRAFVARFPTIETLADADLAEVMALWAGLGYNARAKRLRDAARMIVDRGWPTTPEGLVQLPGVGPYTAAAVASFAFGVKVPAIDTNLRRVLSRWYGTPLDGATLRAVAEAAIGDDAGAWNQAMMDFGATVCRPRRPACGDCPVGSWCSGPDAYMPARPHPRFEGSARQLRGAIVRSVVDEPRTFDDLRRETGFPTEEVAMALEDLMDEELIQRGPDGTYRIGS